jgi:hypothetical protein
MAKSNQPIDVASPIRLEHCHVQSGRWSTASFLGFHLGLFVEDRVCRSTKLCYFDCEETMSVALRRHPRSTVLGKLESRNVDKPIAYIRLPRCPAQNQ